MKAVPAALAAHLEGPGTTLATLWRLTRRDGQQLFFTDHDADLQVAGALYRAGAGYRRSAQRQGEAGADDLELAGVLDSEAISEADLAAGRLDGALVELFVVNWAAPGDGTMQLCRGRLGRVTLEPPGYRAELRDLSDALDVTVGEVYAADCIVALGSARCGVPLEPPLWQPQTAYAARPPRDARAGDTVRPSLPNGRHFRCATGGLSGTAEPAWNTELGGLTADGAAQWQAVAALSASGSVTGAQDRRSFADVGRAEADGFWSFGIVTWTSGANQGLAMEVERHQTGGQLLLKLEMPFEIAVGDGYRIVAGCDKRLATCRDKFDNLDNFRGHGAHLPGNEALLRYPDAR